jgi:hypothetical protein
MRATSSGFLGPRITPLGRQFLHKLFSLAYISIDNMRCGFSARSLYCAKILDWFEGVHEQNKKKEESHTHG